MSKTNLQIFYDRCRTGPLLGPVLSASEVEGLAATLAACILRGLNAADTAYVLATEYRETGGLMQPVRERGGTGYLTRMYDIRGARPTLAKANGNTAPGDGVKFAGRGKCQITWKNNYARIGKLIGLDLVANPDLALGLQTASRIMVDGMIGGWFTGRKLSHTLPRGRRATLAEFKASRPIINGHDCDLMIAEYALIFQNDLVDAGWPL